MMDNLGFCGGGGFLGLGWIFSILIWVLIIVGIVILAKWFMKEVGSTKKEDSAVEILKERYAKGEITKEEFEQKKKELM